MALTRSSPDGPARPRKGLFLSRLPIAPFGYESGMHHAGKGVAELRLCLGPLPGRLNLQKVFLTAWKFGRASCTIPCCSPSAISCRAASLAGSSAIWCSLLTHSTQCGACEGIPHAQDLKCGPFVDKGSGRCSRSKPCGRGPQRLGRWHSCPRHET